MERPELELDQPYFDHLREHRDPGARPIDVWIGRLAIDDGGFRYGDASVPLDLLASNVQVLADWKTP